MAAAEATRAAKVPPQRCMWAGSSPQPVPLMEGQGSAATAESNLKQYARSTKDKTCM